MGEFAKAEINLFKAVEIYSSTGEQEKVVSALSDLGNISLAQGKTVEAGKYILKAFSITRQYKLGEEEVLYGALGDVHFSQGDFKQAASDYTKALDLSRESQDQGGVEIYSSNLARVKTEQQEYSEAAKLFRDSADVFLYWG